MKGRTIQTGSLLKKANRVLGLMLVITLMASCNRNVVYKSYQEIPDMIWNTDYQTKFDFEIIDTTSFYEVDILVRNASVYPSSNIWLFIHQVSPDGNIKTDTLECILADETGKWLGDGMGDIWDNDIPWRVNYKFDNSGKYTYLIEHEMRTHLLPGIMDIGLLIKKQELD